jgi:hypothetical protein
MGEADSILSRLSALDSIFFSILFVSAIDLVSRLLFLELEVPVHEREAFLELFGDGITEAALDLCEILDELNEALE